MIIFKETIDARGFKVIEFKDIYENELSIQESPNDKNSLLLNINDNNPSIMKSDPIDNTEEWIDYSIPEDTYVNIRIHLSKEQIKELIPILQRFVDTGEL